MPQRILVPTDFSKTSKKAVSLAQELATPSGSEIVLLHVVEPVIIGASPELYGAPAVAVDLLAQQEKAAKRELEKMAATIRRKTGSAVKTLVRNGAIHQVIVGVADRVRAQMIVMGTQGRSGLSHLLLGSVAERVVRLARCPVLTVGIRTRVPARTRRKSR